MGGGGSQDSTVTNVTQIDPVTQAWRNSIMGAGGTLYNQGFPNAYPNSQVVPFANQTQQGLDYLQNYAQNGATNLGQANQAQQRAMSGWNPAMSFAAHAASGGLGGNPAIAGLSQFGGANNPHLQSLFNQGAEQVTNAVNGNFMQAGRFGPNAAHTGALGREIGNLYTNIYAPAYEQERNRGLSAQQTMGSLFDSGQNRTLAGIDLMGGMHSQANQDAARATALQPSLWQYGQMPGQSMLDIGGMYEGLAGQYLQDDVNRYNHPYNAAWQHLNNYAGLMSGLPDFSGSQSTTQGPAPNRVMSGLGGGLAGLGVLNSLQGMGLLSGAGMGTAGLFGGAGALLGLFSDRRLKREIEPLDADINGTPLYRFAYVWDAPGVKRVGVMADEAPAHAVSTHESGYAMVDYGAL